MAKITIELTVPNAKLPDLLAAVRWHRGTKEDGSEYTQEEIVTWMKESMLNSLRDIRIRHREYLRTTTPVENDLDIT